MKQIVIVGNGVAGITAARHIRKLSGHQITVISSETPYFFSRTALMYVFMGHLTFENTKPYEDWFWKKNRINLLNDHVERIEAKKKELILRSGATITFDDLVLATGSQSNVFDWPGRHHRGVQTLYSYQDLVAMDAHTRGIKQAVIVGGGLIAVEMAEMLCSRDIDVTILVREPAFWANALPMQEARMISRHIESHGVKVKHNCQLSEVLGDSEGNVAAVRTDDNDEISCQFVGIAVGVHPNISWLRGSAISVTDGVLVNEYLETNVPGIYAAGDCVERTYALEGRKTIEQVWYTARMMGEVVARTICGIPTKYEPGPWFNSAKFFDIEFQTYGNIGNALTANQEDFYWEDRSGQKAVHLVWSKTSLEFQGINSFGIRLRHDTFDQWLRERHDINFVIEHLAEANFDPEFSKRHEREIRDYFKKTKGLIGEPSEINQS
jgi:NAD(P)H-nitrite reductase large subunit